MGAFRRPFGTRLWYPPPEIAAAHGTRAKKKPLLAAALATGATGLEPATSGVTGRRSNRLSYAPEREAVYEPAEESRHARMFFDGLE